MRESRQLIEAELLRQVLRAQQVLLSADEGCIDKARRHYRNVLDVFSGLIFEKGPSQAAKAMRYLRLHQRSRRPQTENAMAMRVESKTAGWTHPLIPPLAPTMKSR
jgi:hypothetical protein